MSRERYRGVSGRQRRRRAPGGRGGGRARSAQRALWHPTPRRRSQPWSCGSGRPFGSRRVSQRRMSCVGRRRGALTALRPPPPARLAPTPRARARAGATALPSVAAERGGASAFLGSGETDPCLQMSPAWQRARSRGPAFRTRCRGACECRGAHRPRDLCVAFDEDRLCATLRRVELLLAPAAAWRDMWTSKSPAGALNNGRWSMYEGAEPAAAPGDSALRTVVLWLSNAPTTSYCIPWETRSDAKRPPNMCARSWPTR